jgi:hypothetical protein
MPLSQKTPGSSEEGSTSGVKRINWVSFYGLIFQSVNFTGGRPAARERAAA